MMDNALLQAGFAKHTKHPAGAKTFILDLTPSLDVLRAQFDKTWRSSLSKAERSNLQVTCGTQDHDYETFAALYAGMLQRKNFTPGVDYTEFAKIQTQLPENQKMQVLICMQDNIPINAAVISAMGNTAIYIMGATDNQYVGANGSYLLQWHILQWLKQAGVRYYDLGGVDEVNNPNVYRFKKGIVGKNAQEVTFMGRYDTAPSIFAAFACEMLEFLLVNLRLCKRRLILLLRTRG
jgi:lipid II:glycine glycyltransferase (peptidoglycan interpeptide bridge formation enzyme)